MCAVTEKTRNEVCTFLLFFCKCVKNQELRVLFVCIVAEICINRMCIWMIKCISAHLFQLIQFSVTTNKSCAAGSILVSCKM